MIIVKKTTRNWAQLGVAAALGALIAAASAAPVDASPAPQQGSAQTVKEWESTDPQNVSNDQIEVSQIVAGAAAKVEGAIASQSDVDFYRIDVPAGHTLSVGLGGAASNHELRLYQYVADDAGWMDMGTFLWRIEADETWTYRELGATAHAGTTGSFAPRSISLSRSMDEYASYGKPDDAQYYLDRLSSAFYVKVQNKTGSISPAGNYMLNFTVTPGAKKPI